MSISPNSLLNHIQKIVIGFECHKKEVPEHMVSIIFSDIGGNKPKPGCTKDHLLSHKAIDTLIRSFPNHTLILGGSNHFYDHHYIQDHSSFVLAKTFAEVSAEDEKIKGDMSIAPSSTLSKVDASMLKSFDISPNCKETLFPCHHECTLSINDRPTKTVTLDGFDIYALLRTVPLDGKTTISYKTGDLDLPLSHFDKYKYYPANEILEQYFS